MNTTTTITKTAITEAVRNFLDENEFRYDYNEDRNTFSITTGLRGMIKTATVRIEVLNNAIYVGTSLAVYADPENKAQLRRMAEFICRVNYWLRSGGFEFDFHDGEIKYKTFQLCPEPPTEDMIIGILSLQCKMIDTYAPGIIKVLAGNCDIEEVIDRCDNPEKYKDEDEPDEDISTDIFDDDNGDQD